METRLKLGPWGPVCDIVTVEPLFMTSLTNQSSNVTMETVVGLSHTQAHMMGMNIN